MRKRFFTAVAVSVATIGGLLCLPGESSAQRRDHLTEAEAELVREAQEIDKRIDVLTYAVRRRILVLNNRPPDNEKESWGELPGGPRVSLLTDIDRIINEAVENIDEVASRDLNNPLFPKAVHSLAGACREFVPDFRSFLDSSNEEKERGPILNSIELCGSAIEASLKVPEPKKKKN